MIITDSFGGGTIIDSIYKVYTIRNIKNCLGVKDSWEIETYENNDINAKYFFFVFETSTSESVSHWVYESAIYLELFIHIRQTYTNIKLIVNGKKHYKKLFFDIFNISDSDIIYTSDLTMNSIPNKFASNTCFFPSPIFRLLSPVCYDLSQKQLIRFIDYFNQINIANTYSIDWLIMPRQKKENYQPNERIIDFTKIITFFLNISSLKSELMNTDTVTDINQQIVKLRSSKNIILCDGAAFSLNLLFCRNKTFYVITRQSEFQQLIFPMARLLISTIASYNNNKFMYFNDQDDFLNYITSVSFNNILEL